MATEIKIALLIGNNGAFAVNPFLGDDTDWAIMADMIGKYDESTNEIVYPEGEQRYVITASVELPVVKEATATKVDAA